MIALAIGIAALAVASGVLVLGLSTKPSSSSAATSGGVVGGVYSRALSAQVVSYCSQPQTINCGPLYRWSWVNFSFTEDNFTMPGPSNIYSTINVTLSVNNACPYATAGYNHGQNAWQCGIYVISRLHGTIAIGGLGYSAGTVLANQTTWSGQGALPGGPAEVMVEYLQYGGGAAPVPFTASVTVTGQGQV